MSNKVYISPPRRSTKCKAQFKTNGSMLTSTSKLNSRFFKLISWYDNEWGYSNRVGNLLKLMIDKGL